MRSQIVIINHTRFRTLIDKQQLECGNEVFVIWWNGRELGRIIPSLAAISSNICDIREQRFDDGIKNGIVFLIEAALRTGKIYSVADWSVNA